MAGTFIIRPNHVDGMFLRVFDNSTLDGAPLVQWDASELSDTLHFELVEEAPPDVFRLQDRFSNKFLTVFGASSKDFAPIILADRLRPGDNQKFPISGNFDNAVVTAFHGGKALDVFAASPINGAPIVQFEPHDGRNQRFRFRAL